MPRRTGRPSRYQEKNPRIWQCNQCGTLLTQRGSAVRHCFRMHGSALALAVQSEKVVYPTGDLDWAKEFARAMGARLYRQTGPGRFEGVRL